MFIKMQGQWALQVFFQMNERQHGAFRRHGIEDLCYDHRTSALSRIDVDWLDAHGIAYRRDQDSVPVDLTAATGLRKACDLLFGLSCCLPAAADIGRSGGAALVSSAIIRSRIMALA